METTIKNFLEYIRTKKGSSVNTILAYQSDLAQLQKILQAKLEKDVTPGDINQDTIQAYADWLSDQGYRPSTVARKVAAVRSYLDYMIRFEELPDPDIGDSLRTEATPRRKPRILSDEEMERLLQSPRQKKSARNLRDAAILAVLFKTGLRAAELVSLKMDDLDRSKNRIIRENGGTSLKLGETGSILEQYLTDGRPHLARYPDEKAVFLNQRGRQLSRQGLWLIVKRWAMKAGLGDDISPHTLRHSLAYSLLQEGHSRREVQDVLGLSSPNSIRVLSKLDLEEE